MNEPVRGSLVHYCTGFNNIQMFNVYYIAMHKVHMPTGAISKLLYS